MRALYPPHIMMLIVFAVSGLADAANVPGLYSATVPVADRSEEARLQAYQDSLAAVLVKVTGDRNISSDPEFLPLLETAPVLLQQYRYTADDELWAAFDGPRSSRCCVIKGCPSGAVIGRRSWCGWP
ncbi:MAG: DUF2066 domain-containing protein [Gammaproteobacteria bacterium]|nr:DUF2066 domain-containing protein [Gammaproteobacteria bacterium]